MHTKLLPWLLLFALPAVAQQDSTLRLIPSVEVALQVLQQKTFYSKKEFERFEGNKEFLAEWEKIVHLPATLTYSFNLKDVSILTSPDKNVRVITWNIPKDDGTHYYFGYVLARRIIKKKKGLFHSTHETEYNAFPLLDRSATIKSPETHTGNPNNWFGMLYTAMIANDGYYTLLGWDGNNKLTQRKFVDVLTFRSNGQPVFGKDVFRIPRKNPRRLMFEYSSEVVMSLRYDARNNRIVYSHLSAHSEDPMLEKQYQFYGPDGSFDALVQHKGRWEVKEDIDARNERSKNDNVKKPDPRKQIPIYKPN